MSDILLIAADWQFRALVRAQLLEEGFKVKALPSLDIVLAHLLRGGERPRLTIIDTKDTGVEVQALLDLCTLTGEAPLILCGGAPDLEALGRAADPPAHVLRRPFRIGNVIDLVKKVWV